MYNFNRSPKVFLLFNCFLTSNMPDRHVGHKQHLL
jgi:hypothetical protein